MLKKVIIGLQVVILIAVGYLLYAHFQTPEVEPVKPYVFNEKGAAISKLSSDDIIVYYNIDTLNEKSVYIQNLTKSLKSNAERAKINYQRRKDSFVQTAQTKGMNYEAGRMTQLEYDTWATQAAEEEKQIYAEGIRLEESLLKEQNESYKKVHDAILHCMRELSKGKKIKFILSHSETSPIVMPMEGAVDLTSDMVKVMNDLYKK